MIDDLLDVSRLEHGEVRASIERVSAGDVVREAVNLAEPLIAERGLRVETDLGSCGHRYVLADFRRLRQVLINLISNAVKYNRAGGSIAVALSQPAAGSLRFEVSDTGHGIAPDDLERLFRPFERLEAATSGPESGTGLGLALSKGLVEEMGGQIGVASEVGVGTTFHVDMPTAEEDDPGSGAMPEGGVRAWPSADLLSATILYVEDNPANIRLMEAIFAGQPRVRLVSTGRGLEAVELAERHRPDLVLLDVHLPDVDGESVLRRLSSRLSTASIPVVVVSADATVERRESFLSAGAAGYVTKPIDVDRFVAAVRTVLGQGGAGPSSSSGSSVTNPSTTSGSN
jgi:CheY-like chemotaxis protein/anti-sigma regulatory factor (Ser/Thr protein kinase)